MTVPKFTINVQILYDVVILGKDAHRPALDEQTSALMRARHFARLEKITLKYMDEDGKEVNVNAADNSNNAAVRVKIFFFFLHTDRYGSDRDQIKRKLGLSELNCSNYMPEIIDGKAREWTVDNLEDAINAFRK